MNEHNPTHEELDESLDALWAETIQRSGSGGEAFDATHTFQPIARGTDRHARPSGFGLPHFTLDERATRGGLHDDSGSGSGAPVEGAGVHSATLFVPPPSSDISPIVDPVGPRDETMIEGPPSESKVETLDTPEGQVHDFDPETDEQHPLYTIQEVIGRGGMGVVYRAHQGSLQRDVALKRMRARRGDARAKQRFLAEAVVNGRLDHPNIVPVYDLGFAPDGEAILAMKLVDGVPWSSVLHPKTPEERDRAQDFGLVEHLGVLIQVCNAVAFAHSRFLVHNDLKPQNVMLGEFGEVLVMDWGLAVDVSPEPDPTGSIPHKTALTHPCGTPAYIPPELAEGRGEDVGPWTDVYLLGATLYEVIKGKPPHQADTIKGVLLRAMKSKPPTFAADVPEELATICRRAMAREAGDRYRTTILLREALEDFLTHRESLRVTESAQELLASCRARDASETRDRLYADYGEAIAAFGQALVLWEGNPEAAAGRGAARLAYARAALSHGDLGLAEAQLARIEAGDEARALRAQVGAARAADERATRAAQRLRWGLAAAVAVIVAGLAVGLALISAEQRRTALQAQRALEAQTRAEQERAAADQSRGEAERRYADSLVAHAQALGSTGRWSEARERFNAARELYVRIQRSTTPAELGLLAAEGASPEPIHSIQAHAGEARAVAFGPRGELVSAGADGTLRAWESASGHLARHHLLASDLGKLRDVAVSPVGSWVATAGDEGALYLTPLHHAGPLRRLEGHTGAVYALGFDYEGLNLVSAGEDRTVRLWDTITGEQKQVYERHGDVVESAFLAPNPRYLFSGDRSGQLVWWNKGGSVHWDYATSPKSLRPPALPIRAMVHSPEGTGSRIAFCSGRTARVLAFNKGINNFLTYLVLEGHQAPVTGIAYAPSGKTLVTVGLDARLLVWSLEKTDTTTDPKSLPLELVASREVSIPAAALDVAVDPQGAFVAVADRDGSVHLWDLGLGGLQKTGAERARVPLSYVKPPPPPFVDFERGRGPPVVEVSPYTCAAFSPEGTFAATGDAKGGLTLWEGPIGRSLQTLELHTQGVAGLSFLGLGRLLSVGNEGWVQVWDLNTLGALSSLDVGRVEGAKSVVRACAISPDGRTVALGLEGGVLVRVDALAGKERARVQLPGEGPALEVTAVALADDGRLAYATRAGGLVLLGSPPLERPPGSRPLRALAWVGQRLASGDDEGEVGLWDVSARKRVGEVRAHGDAVTKLRAWDPARSASAGGELISAGSDGTWRVWDLPSLEEVRTFAPPLGPLVDVALDPAGERLLAVGKQRFASWDLSLARRKDAQRATHSRDRPAPRWLALQGALRPALEALPRESVGADALLRMRLAWELGLTHTALASLERIGDAAPAVYVTRVKLALARELEVYGALLGTTRGRVRGFAFPPGGGTIVSASERGTLEERSISTGSLQRTLLRHSGDIRSMATSPDGATVAYGDQSGGFGAVSLERGERLWFAKPKRIGTVEDMRFHPDGERLILATWNREVQVWSRTAGRQTGSVGRLGKRQPRSLGVSPSGRWVVASDSAGELWLWDYGSGNPTPRTWKGDGQGSSGGVSGLTFLGEPGQEELHGWCHRDKRLRVWSLAGELLRQGEVGGSSVYGVGVNPEHGLMVTGATSRFGGSRMTVWDTKTGREITSWLSEEVILQAAISADGATVFTGAKHGAITLRRFSR